MHDGKTESIKHAYHYKRAYKKGKFAVTKDLVMYCISNGSEKNRLGITVKKNVGKSVKRNRIRRLIRENYRLMGPDLKKGYDLVFVVRNIEVEMTFWSIKDSMEYMFRKLNLIMTGNESN